MLRLLSRLRTKASATTRLQVQAVRGQHAIWTPRRFDQLIAEGYEQAVWVYACVTWLTRMAKSTRWIVLIGDDEAPSTHPLLTLMNRPNGMQSGAAFLESAYGYWLTAGNAYIERVGPRARAPVELWVKRPDRMRIIPHPTNLISGYQYEVAGLKHEFEAWQIKHLKTWAPLDDWYGMSPLAAAARGIDVFNAGQAHNLALIQNGARPTGAWINQGSLTDDQFRNLREQIDDATSVNQRGRPLLLEGGTTWQEMGLSPRDLDFLAGQTDAARQIHAAYGVHPVVTGLATGTFENQQQAVRSALINAVLPFLDQLAAELNEWIAPLYGADVALAYDRDAFPAMSEDQESLWKRATMGFTRGFVTRDEARVMVGFDEVGGERGSVFSDEMAARAAPTSDPDGAEVDDVEPDDDEPAETRARKVRALTTPKLQAEYWRARVDLQEAWEPTLERIARQAFGQERAELRAALATATDPTAALAIIETIVTPTRWAALEPAWLAAMTAGGRDALQQITGKSHALKLDADAFTVFREVFGFAFEATLNRARSHIPRISGLISTTTLDQLRGIIGDAARAGLSINDIADHIDALYLDQIIPNRSVVIARTEVISATNYGSQAAAEGTNLDLEKVWLTALDGRQRQSHDEANGQRVPLHGKFAVGGYALAHPGDPDGPVEEIVQCRCTQYYEEVNP